MGKSVLEFITTKKLKDADLLKPLHEQTKEALKLEVIDELYMTCLCYQNIADAIENFRSVK